MSDFERAVEFIFKWEGGYVADPADPGGETRFGISKREYPDVDIKGLTKVRAKEIYRRDYWQKAGCPALPWPLSLIVLDTAVNMGVGRAGGFLGLVRKSEGVYDWTEYLFLRIEYYSRVLGRKYPQFLRGWINRVIDLYKLAVDDNHPLSGYEDAGDMSQAARRPG
ncbi:MAG: glycoside hydrolase family 108 protein [Thermodesulfobacteriota bacterium]